MDVDAEDEEFTDLHIDFPPGEVDFAGRCDLRWDLLRRVDSVVYKIFVERCLKLRSVRCWKNFFFFKSMPLRSAIEHG